MRIRQRRKPVPDPESGARSRRLSGGQSLVEFALILPVLLMLVLGALDLGRAFMGWVVLNNAARVGANYAALNPNAWGAPGNLAQQDAYDARVRDARSDAAFALAGCTSEAVPDPRFPTGTKLGDYAVVELRCVFDPITPLMGDLMPTLGIPLNVSARSVFPIRFGSIAISSPSEPPTGCLTAPFEAQADGLSVQFRDTTSGSDGWLWRVGSFATYNTVNPTHDFPQEGTYPVTLTATVGSVDCNAYGPVDISVEPTPAPTPTPDPNATPTPTPDPNATPTPTATPAPDPTCNVPVLTGRRPNAAATEWASRNFTVPPVPVDGAPLGNNWTVNYQSITSNLDVPCNVTMLIGPDPVPTP